MLALTKKYSFFLLPGLDGTGKTYKWLQAEMLKSGVIPDDIYTIVYGKETNYYTLADIVTKKMKESEFPVFVLAESFAGPLALILSQQYPVDKMVLCGTFGVQPNCTYMPRAMMDMIKYMPTSFFPLHKMPIAVLNSVLINEYGDKELKSLMKEIFKSADPAAIDGRLHEVFNLPRYWEGNKFAPINIPTLIIKPLNDRLILPTSSDILEENLPNSTLIELDAPHMLFQTHAKKAWKSIVKFDNSHEK